MHDRTARPTLRVLREDLTSGWESVAHERAVRTARTADLHPLSGLLHPIVRKAAASFDDRAADDQFVGPIAASTTLLLREIKQSQWRGGVWEDPESGVCWLVVAGLAKGGHQDHDDFYRFVSEVEGRGGTQRWLPTPEDVRLLKRETAARLRLDWELGIQRSVGRVLTSCGSGGSDAFAIHHPVDDRRIVATVEVTVAPLREDGDEVDDIVIEVAANHEFLGSALLWQAIVRVLISVEPPEQSWDRFDMVYSNIGEPGAWRQRAQVLETMNEAAELAVSVPGSTSHFTHQEHLTDRTVRGSAVRGLCGAYFVPSQDHDSLPVCPTCEERLRELPA